MMDTGGQILPSLRLTLRDKENGTYWGTVEFKNLTVLIQDGSQESNSGDVTLSPREVELSGNSQGAGYFVIAVVLVYGMSIVMLIGSHIKRKHAKVLQDKQIDKYLREFQTVKENSSKDQYKKLKQSIKSKLGDKACKHKANGIGDHVGTALASMLAIGAPAVTHANSVTSLVSQRSRRSSFNIDIECSASSTPLNKRRKSSRDDGSNKQRKTSYEDAASSQRKSSDETASLRDETSHVDVAATERHDASLQKRSRKKGIATMTGHEPMEKILEESAPDQSLRAALQSARNFLELPSSSRGNQDSERLTVPLLQHEALPRKSPTPSPVLRTPNAPVTFLFPTPGNGTSRGIPVTSSPLTPGKITFSDVVQAKSGNFPRRPVEPNVWTPRGEFRDEFRYVPAIHTPSRSPMPRRAQMPRRSPTPRQSPEKDELPMNTGYFANTKDLDDDDLRDDLRALQISCV